MRPYLIAQATVAIIARAVSLANSPSGNGKPPLAPDGFGLNCPPRLRIMFVLLPARPTACSRRSDCAMKTKTRHRKSHMWRKKADSSPIAKGRRPKRQGRNPKKRKHRGGVGL